MLFRLGLGLEAFELVFFKLDTKWENVRKIFNVNLMKTKIKQYVLPLIFLLA